MAALSSAAAGKVETLESVVEITSNADKLYSMVSNQHHQVPKASSENIHEVEVHEGDWETSGSVKLWKYTIDGNFEVIKERVEIDEANKTVSLTGLEGHMLEQYKSFKVIYQVTPNPNTTAEEGGLVKITIEYEKLNENDSPPHKFLSLVVKVIQHIDAHLLKK